MKTPKGKKPATKKVSYELIERETEIGRHLYARLNVLVDRHHDDLQDARIALAWCTSWKPDVDGRVTLGKCQKASDLSRELAPFDFVILLNQDFWTSVRVTNAQRDALLDHELMHAAVAYDADGAPKRDDRGRTVYRIRKHDIEEFRDIVARHGCYKGDLEAFARALHQAEASTAGTWIGYSRLHEELKGIGVHVPADRIATWSDAERSDVHIWALLRQDDDSRTLGVLTTQSMPPCLAAAVAPATH
jgi:hypothetical protein